MAISELIERIKSLENKKAQVGWFKSSQYRETGMPVALVAVTQEFGSDEQDIPPRPFMRPTVADKKGEWAAIAKQEAERILTGDTDPEVLLTLLGGIMEGDIVKTIADLADPELSKVTLLLRLRKDEDPSFRVDRVELARARKDVKNDPDIEVATGDRAKPLHDTGYMITTLSHEVVEK